MYTPLQVDNQNRKSTQVSTMAQKGLNLEGLPELMDLEYAKKIVNYIPYSFGIATRGGLEKKGEVAGLSSGITLSKYYTDDKFVVGYGTTIAIFDLSAQTFTNLKTDFSTSVRWGGGRYGDYFFVTNGVDKPYRISQTLNYDAQTANFTVGSILTGGTSGATAVILEDSDSGVTGTLTLGKISGTFQNNEIITDVDGGSATSDGTLTFIITEITNAPICDDISFVGPRAVAISLSTDETAVQISEVGTGANPPFNTWNTGTGNTQGAIVSFRNAGKARSCVPLGPYFVVFSDEGYFAFSVDQLDSAGTLKKVETVQDYITDFGGARGAITTPEGIFYINEAGLWRMLQVGQTDVPYSRQQQLTTVLLDDSYFANANLDNADLVYDEVQKLILVTYADGSTVNNKVLAYKKSDEIEALFEIEGWSLNRFTKYNKRVYASSSVDGRIFECFKGHTDDGLAIATEYTQELPLNGLWTKHALNRFYNKGFLSIDSVVDVYFDIYDAEGEPLQAKRGNRWTAQRNDNVVDEWGSASWGQSAWGGDFDLSSMVESFDGCRPKISRAQRISVRYVSSVTVPHIINWFSAEIIDKSSIRVRKMAKII